MAITEIQVDSIPNLVTEVLKIAKNQATDAFLWFRGNNCGSYDLLPGLLRDGKPGDSIFEREARLTTRFRQRSIAYWAEGYPQTDWEHLFAMQHYGMPTRLLDWTENLTIAAYFALWSAANPTGHAHAGACKPCIWCVDPVQWNRGMPSLLEYGDSIRVLTTADDHLDAYRPETKKKRLKSPVAIYGTHNSQRIVAQRGTFFAWGNETKPMQQVAQSTPNVELFKFELTAPVPDLYSDIQKIGVTETTVFPELSALAKELTRLEDWK